MGQQLLSVQKYLSSMHKTNVFLIVVVATLFGIFFPLLFAPTSSPKSQVISPRMYVLWLY